MSKTKLALLVFCVAFGVNLGAFFLSNKAFTVEELKNVWIFELPPSASPLDAYGATDLGPQQGIIGTLFKPNLRTAVDAKQEQVTETLLADTWTWNEKAKQLTVRLKDKLTFSDHSPITAENFVQSAQFIAPTLQSFVGLPEWEALANAQWAAKDPQTLVISLSKLSSKFDFQKFMKEVLTHPLAGVIHPDNLKTLKAGEKITGKWISSGPYRVRKWNPKEITLVSRDDFPVMMPKEFFRTVRFQSAPVRNPSCHFVQAAPGEEKGLQDHRLSPTEQSLHVFWICRSWNEKGTFCANPTNRETFSKVIAGTDPRSSLTLASQKVRYRIPTGSDAFRGQIRERIETDVKLRGGTVEEISYFFKPSTDADIELLFVVTPKGENETRLAADLAKLSSRLGTGSANEKNLVGEIATFPIQIMMKEMQGEVYDRVFLLPDLEQKLPM